VKYVDLARQWESERSELLPLIDEELGKGDWVGGDAVEALEVQLAEYLGVRHVVAVASGTDALMMALSGAGVKPGDEVITVPNSFIATTAAICHVGAIPVFVDVGEDQNMNVDLIESAISSKTAAILPVHLTGRMADMRRIMDIANKYGLTVIEDAAQAIGSSQAGRLSGTWGDVGCFSTHPLKNLNAIGDGGFLTTNDAHIADHARLIRSHGLVDRDHADFFGLVSRLDTVKAITLSYRLSQLGAIIERRQETARYYFEQLAPLNINCLRPSDSFFDTHHTYVIQVDFRDRFRKNLESWGVQTRVHYPVLITNQVALKTKKYRVVGDLREAKRQSVRIVSLPIHQYLTRPEKEYVVTKSIDALAAHKETVSI
jgi:dTDP-4-amino-4,6-dideoxygalactose transaminase